MLFEISKCDLAGRIGTLETNHGKVQTPAFVPVIHPVKQSIPASKLKEMGFDMVITNAYITMKNYGQEAVERGIHDIIKYDGSVMTDSGGYQVLEYGKVDVTPEAMAAFESGIGSDIAIPLDKPTGFGMPEKKAKSYVDHTLKLRGSRRRAHQMLPETSIDYGLFRSIHLGFYRVQIMQGDLLHLVEFFHGYNFCRSVL